MTEAEMQKCKMVITLTGKGASIIEMIDGDGNTVQTCNSDEPEWRGLMLEAVIAICEKHSFSILMLG